MMLSKKIKKSTPFEMEIGMLLNPSELYSIPYELSKIKMVVIEIDDVVEKKATSIKEELDKEEYEVRRSMYYQQDIYFFINDYHDTVRKSLFLSLYSLFEANLNDVIRLLNDYVVISNGKDDLPSKGKQLKEHNLIDNGGAEWKTLLEISRIRTVIAHYNSILPPTKPRLFELKNKVEKGIYPGLAIKDGHLKIENSSFLDFCIGRFLNLFHEIYGNSNSIENPH